MGFKGLNITRACFRDVLHFYFQQIYFSNLPATVSQHENYDAEYRVIQIRTSDQNGDHDNVTCEMTSYSPAESNMFQLRTDYKYQYNCKDFRFCLMVCPNFIMKTCPCNVNPLESHFYIEKLGFAGVNLGEAVLTCTHSLCFEQK